MIAALADFFVERPAPRTPENPGAKVSRVLAVNALQHADRLPVLLEEVERIAPAAISCIPFADVDELPDVVPVDSFWIFVDASSDLAYCALVGAELERRLRLPVTELVGVGVFEGCDAAIDSSALAGGLPWRRRSAVTDAAVFLACHLDRGIES